VASEPAPPSPEARRRLILRRYFVVFAECAALALALMALGGGPGSFELLAGAVIAEGSAALVAIV
jgi:hypothetical protein